MNISLAVVVAYAGVGLLGCGGDPVEGSDSNGSETDGTEVGDGDGDNTEVGDGDGDNTEVGDGDGDTAETGETGPDDGVCGDGVVDEGEECDDGNDVDDDECSNACVAAVCGDGVVQEAAGEECDDGNNDSGDGCLADCMFPGGMIGEEVIDFGESTNDIAEKVVIGSDDSIGVLLKSANVFRLAQYSSSIEWVYDVPALNTKRPSLAIGPNDLPVIGGDNAGANSKASVRQYDIAGVEDWTEESAGNNSSFLDVAVDSEGFVIAAGYTANIDPLLARYDDTGDLVWSMSFDEGNAFGPVTVDSAGHIYVVRQTPPRVETYASDETAGWFSENLPNADYRDIAVDMGGNVYLLSEANNGSKFMLSRFDDTGTLVWTVEHDDPGVDEGAGGLTLLSGAILVAGWTNELASTADGLLVWYGTNGDLLHELVLEGAAAGASRFFDVAVSPAGDHAVAVGEQSPTNNAGDLWIYKFEI